MKKSFHIFFCMLFFFVKIDRVVAATDAEIETLVENVIRSQSIHTYLDEENGLWKDVVNYCLAKADATIDFDAQEKYQQAIMLIFKSYPYHAYWYARRLVSNEPTKKLNLFLSCCPKLTFDGVFGQKNKLAVMSPLLCAAQYGCVNQVKDILLHDDSFDYLVQGIFSTNDIKKYLDTEMYTCKEVIDYCLNKMLNSFVNEQKKAWYKACVMVVLKVYDFEGYLEVKSLVAQKHLERLAALLMCDPVLNPKPEWIERSNICSKTPLHIAASYADVDLVKKLVAGGANLFVQDDTDRGNYPVQTAINSGALAVLNYLISVDRLMLFCKNSDGKDSFAIAQDRNIESITTILEQANSCVIDIGSDN